MGLWCLHFLPVSDYALEPGRAREESYSLYPAYPSRSGSLRFTGGRCPRRHEFRAAYGAEELAELPEKVSEATEKGTEEGAKIAKEGDEQLEEAAPDSPLRNR